MLYDDARTAPKTAEEHERDAYGSTYLTGEEARRILAAHKVAGRSKLGADEARRMAREQWPDEVRAAREAKVVRYRWLVAEVYAAGAAYREAAPASASAYRSKTRPTPMPPTRSTSGCRRRTSARRRTSTGGAMAGGPSTSRRSSRSGSGAFQAPGASWI